MSHNSSQRPQRPTGDGSPVQRISGPAELLSAVPYLLGFHPRSSLVLVGLDAGTLVVTARLDLADAEDREVLAGTVQALAAGGTTALIAVLYDDDRADERLRATVMELEDVGRGVACPVGDVLIVRDGRWRSALCIDDGCCPDEGRPLPRSTTPFVVAATVAGIVPMRDRDALAASLARVDRADGDEMAALLSAAEDAEFQITVEGGRARHERSMVRTAMRLARASDQLPWTGVDDATVARLGVALGSLSVRDPVWMGLDDRRVDGRPLWRELSTRLPAPYDAAPLFLLAWASWRAGEGALAGMAAERALDSDSSYSAADLLIAALSRGIDPRSFPKLRLPRSA